MITIHNLANNCYLSMLEGCTSLTSAQALPATTLAKQLVSYTHQVHLVSLPVGLL